MASYVQFRLKELITASVDYSASLQQALLDSGIYGYAYYCNI